MSITDDIENLIFPFDAQAHLYHLDGLASIGDVMHCMEVFLRAGQEQVEKTFLVLAGKAQIDVFSSEDGYSYSGVYRPATRVGAQAIFDFCHHNGMDWFYWDEQIIMFSVVQIETMINEGIKGHKQPFSIDHFIKQKKVQDLLNEPLKEKGIKPDRPIHTRERNTLLRIIAALAIELKIPLTDSYKAGMVIEALTDKLGEGVDHATIEMKVKDISKLIKVPSS